VTHVNKTVINNTYVNNNFAKNVNASRTSFNGGNGGIKAEPNAEQRAAMANAKKEGPTSQQLERQKLASKDQNLRASVNKGKPNQDAIRSFNKNEGVGQGKGAQEVGAAGGAAGPGNKLGDLSERQGQGATAGPGAGKKPGNLSERQGQGETAGAGKTGKEPGNMANRKGEGAGAGAGNAENNRADMAGRNRPGMGAGDAGAGQAGPNANKHKAGNQFNRGNMGGNQAKMHTPKMQGAGGPGGQPHMRNQMSRNPQMGAGNAQMGGKHPQMGGGGKPPKMGGGGGNRPQPKGQQQQGKKKPNER
jgi:hypothetical protein